MLLCNLLRQIKYSEFIIGNNAIIKLKRSESKLMFVKLLLILGIGGLTFHFITQKNNLDYDPSKPHHRTYGFINRYNQITQKIGFLKWQWDRIKNGLPKPPTEPITSTEPDLKLIQNNRSETYVTWVGHATVLLQVSGKNILTDPHFGDRASPISFLGPKRHQPPGIKFEDLPKIDYVLISHNHYDHLDYKTVQRLMDSHKPIFLVPLGVQHWFKKNVGGAIVDGSQRNVIALDWDDKYLDDNLEFHFLAIQHWSARTPFDRSETLWGSWAVIHPNFRFWFSGDLGYSQDTVDIGKKFGGFDLAAIAIGAYEPRWFMKKFHIDPVEAVQVMKDIQAKKAIGIHWGTFEGLTDEQLDQPPRDLEKTLQGTNLDFTVLKHGETLNITNQ